MQAPDELIGCNARLLQDACECAYLQLPMIRDHATSRTATQYDVASTLSGDNEAKALQRSHYLGAGYARKVRHSLPLETS